MPYVRFWSKEFGLVKSPTLAGSRSGGSTGDRQRKGFLQGGKIGLRGREIARLEILAELFDALFVRSAGGAELLLEEAAA